MKQYLQCEYCDKVYQQEKRFLAHTCREKERAIEVKTVYGQIAFAFYDMWLVLKYKRGAKDITAFIESRYYKAFIRFALFVRSVSGLANSELFLAYVVANRIDPSSWCTNEVFVRYLVCLENSTSADEKVMRSVNTLDKLAVDYNCNLNDIFQFVHYSVILQNIREQKISPWLLLNSQKFHNFLRALPSEHQVQFDQLIDGSYWKLQFDKDNKQVITIRACIKNLTL